MPELEYEEYYFTKAPYSPYQDFPRHIKVVEKILSFKPLSVLDVGCAYGFIVKHLLEKGIDAYGCDISHWCEQKANELIPGRYTRCPAWQLPFENKQFDLLYCEGTLEHIPESKINIVMSEFYRVAQRRLLYISFTGDAPGHVCMHDVFWWMAKLPANTYLGYSGNSSDLETIYIYKGEAMHQTIGVGLIARNAGTTIKQCIKSFAPFVEQIVVVLAGKSTDNTAKEARKGSSKVELYNFEWIDDFAAARNFSFSKLNTDWLF